MPTVQFFEIPADDLQRAKKFYNELFGWKIEKEETNNEGSESQYLFFKTTDENGRPGIGGGRNDEKTAPSTNDLQFHHHFINRQLFFQNRAIGRKNIGPQNHSKGTWLFCSLFGYGK
jgi:predicted enzyme related to lactoylglutathione lyase